MPSLNSIVQPKFDIRMLPDAAAKVTFSLLRKFELVVRFVQTTTSLPPTTVLTSRGLGSRLTAHNV